MSLPTARQVLAAKGLAKEFADDGVTPARGRFSREAVAYLATLTEGVDYVGVAAVKAAKAPATPRTPKTPAAPKAALPGDVDAKEVREWAAENGHAVNARGRLPLAVVAAFIKADGSRTGARAKPVVVNLAPRVRNENRGYIVEGKTLLAFDLCATKGGCGNTITRCKCANGPVAPHYLPGNLSNATLLLSKPAL